MSEWIKVCDARSLQNGDLVNFDFADKNILLTKAENKVYAIDRILYSCLC